jgi:hypothetical protein
MRQTEEKIAAMRRMRLKEFISAFSCADCFLRYRTERTANRALMKNARVYTRDTPLT